MKCALTLFTAVLVQFSLQGPNAVLPVVSIGNNLADCLRNHTFENSDLLLKSSVNYYSQLKDVYGLMLSKSGADVIKGMAVFNVIEELGGPPHTNIEINYKLLQEKWNDGEKNNQFKTTIQDTKELWKTMKERANWLRNGIPDPETEEHAASEAPSGSSEGDLH